MNVNESHQKNAVFMPSALLNEKEAGALLGMSVHWLRRKRWEGGGIPFIRLGDGPKGAVRYRLEDIEGYVASRVRRSTSDTGKKTT
jgi:predicted DNA-binding transcriptional regulator AlpA